MSAEGRECAARILAKESLSRRSSRLGFPLYTARLEGPRWKDGEDAGLGACTL